MTLNFIASTIWADDLEQARQFYTNIIGLETIEENRDDRALFKLGHNQYLFIIKGQPSAPTKSAIKNFPVVAFRVEDIDKTFEMLSAHGIKTLNGIESDDWSRWVLLYDPAGNLIELAELTKEL